MVKALHLAHRAIRNPRKYLDRAFLRTAFVQAKRRTKLAALFGAPYVVKSVRSGPRSVAFFPSPIDTFLSAEIYLIWKVLRLCGARPAAADAVSPDLAIAWHPSTVYTLERELLERIRARCGIINARCTDIRKSIVDRTFADVFGYGLPVDPASYEGTIVRKSERNGPHDAFLLDGPIARTEPGYVYQRLVTCETPKGIAEWRTVIVAGEIASVYVNYRPAGSRFQIHASSSEYCAVNDAFSRDEQRKIADFSRRMGLDFGALDILRDADGRLYICDCNNTPTGPSERLKARDHYRVTSDAATALERAYFR